MSNPTVWSAVLGGLPRYALDDPSRTALVVVDMQYLDAHPDYGIGKTLKERGTFHLVEGYFDRVKDATGVIAKLLDACRQTGIEVIYITIASRTQRRPGAEPGPPRQRDVSPRSARARRPSSTRSRPRETRSSSTRRPAASSTRPRSTTCCTTWGSRR